MKLEGKVAVVTGSGGAGCGRAIATLFAAEGAAVVVSDVDEERARETMRAIEGRSGRAALCLADVRDDAAVHRLIAFAEATYGGVDILVNNASAPHGGEGVAGWIDPLQTDLLGAMHATSLAIDAMRKRGAGAIVNIASISALWHGRKTPGGLPGYDVAKAGMIRMTTVLASLGTTERIRVNCLAPGWIGTEPVRTYWESLSPADRMSRGVPSRLLSTSEVAGAVFRLATDESLAGRVVAWWSEDEPVIVEWGDRGYRRVARFAI